MKFLHIKSVGICSLSITISRENSFSQALLLRLKKYYFAASLTVLVLARRWHLCTQ